MRRAKKDSKPIFSIRNLRVVLRADEGERVAIEDFSFDLFRGETVALVGESGSGKTLSALCAMRLLPPDARIVRGEIFFQGRDVLSLSENEMRKLRGDRMAMIFQEPSTSLNPLMQVGNQLAEPLRIHQGQSKSAARDQALALMELVGIPDPVRRYKSYPHQLSGGIRQRLIVAMALTCRPDLLIADEPTSALDTTVQAQLVDLLSKLIRDLGMSVVLITHDLGVVAALADRVIVVHSGRILEEGSKREVLTDPLHPYTRSLLTARPLFRSGEHPQIGLVTDQAQLRAGRIFATCPFAELCPHCFGDCREHDPDLVEVAPDRRVRCSHFDSHGPKREFNE